MKTYSLMMLVGSTLVFGLTGCSDPNAPADDTLRGTNAMRTTTPPAQGAGAVTSATQSVGSGTGYAVETVQPQVPVVTGGVQQAVTDAGAGMQAQFNAVVEDVKKLMAEGKGTEAVQKITTALGSMQLTPEQQKVLTDLQQQAMTAVGNLLPTRPQN